MSITRHRIIAIIAATVAAAILFWFVDLLPYRIEAKNTILFVAWLFVAVAVLGVVTTVYHLVRGSRRS